MKSNSTNSEKCIKRGETSDNGNEKCIKRSETSDKGNEKCIKRSEKVNKLLTQLELGTKELFNSEKYKNYLTTFSKFTKYSINNTILIYLQNPNATLVAGYKAWETKFKRHVKQGEQGITILAPMKYNKDPDDDESESFIIYRPVTVFDISQTEGEELPSFSPELLTQSVDGYEKFMLALAKTTDYKIVFKDLAQEINGKCSHLEKTIYIRKGMGESQNIKTLLHEIAHSKLHKVSEAHQNGDDTSNGSSASQDGNDISKAGNDTSKPLPNGKDISIATLSRNEKEVEAESVAFVVSTYFGIDTSSYSFTYIVGWEENDESLLRHSLKRIRDTAHVLIAQIEKELHEDELNKEELNKDDLITANTDGNNTGLSKLNLF